MTCLILTDSLKSMAKFAIYTIPPAEHPLYVYGSEMLGYDIRAGKVLPEDTPTRQHFGVFNPAWVSRAQEYGLHATTAGTYEYNPNSLQLDDVIGLCETIVASINPAHPLELTAHPTEFIWQSGFVGLRYEPNLAFQTLHTVLCSLLPRFGINSRPLRQLNENPALYGEDNHLTTRVQQFFTPYIFDDFTPHFTLLNPYNGEIANLNERLMALFGDLNTLTVNSVCLVRLQDGHTHYELVHEFVRRR